MTHIKNADLPPEHQRKPNPEPLQESFVRDMVWPECCFQPPAVRVFVGYLGLSPRCCADDQQGNGGNGNGDGGNGGNGAPAAPVGGNGGNGNGGNGNQDSAGPPTKWMRLYTTLDFTDFIEVEWKDVVHHKKSTAAMLPIEGTILWVRSDAKIWHTRVQSRSVTAGDFLRGPIAEQQLPGVQQTLMGGATRLIDTPSWGEPC